MCERAQLVRRGCRRSVWRKPGVQRRKLGKIRLECVLLAHTPRVSSQAGSPESTSTAPSPSTTRPTPSSAQCRS